MPQISWILYATFLALGLCGVSHAEEVQEQSHSTSVAGMVKLLELEAKLIDNLENYANELRQKVIVLRSAISEMRAESEKARAQKIHYLSNPLNAYSLIRRMHHDWIYWQLYMEQPIGEAQIEYLEKQRGELPSSTDAEEAAVAIARIQSTYDLNVPDIAKGLLYGKQYNVSLGGLDSYSLGKYYYDHGNYMHASQWLYQAIEWTKNNTLPEPLQIDRSVLLTIYAETLMNLTRYADALKVINIALNDKKNDFRLLRRKAEIETQIRMEPNAQPKIHTKPVVGAYERGCRGQFSQLSKLHCLYNKTTTPFLRLAPLKMELVQLDPYIVLYHDAISDEEIRTLQEMATPGLTRATVYNVDLKRSTAVATRTSKYAWFPDGYNQVTERLNRRIHDMTGFDLNGSEMLQAMNYGLGGHYVKHFDFFNVSRDLPLVAMNGDRIATVLFYMSDVEQGGATVFPNIQKAVLPQRGSVIMWHNLLNDGQGNAYTLHAACPVIVGSKWVCNKWIRENQQMFIKPCPKPESPQLSSNQV